MLKIECFLSLEKYSSTTLWKLIVWKCSKADKVKELSSFGLILFLSIKWISTSSLILPQSLTTNSNWEWLYGLARTFHRMPTISPIWLISMLLANSMENTNNRMSIIEPVTVRDHSTGEWFFLSSGLSKTTSFMWKSTINNWCWVMLI